MRIRWPRYGYVWLALGLAAVVVLGRLLVLNMGSDRPRSNEITSTTETFWRAIGVAEDDLVVGGYGRRDMKDVTGCADLPEDDRWVASQTTDLPGDRYDRQQLWERANRYLDENGYDNVTRYRLGTERLRVRGERAERVIVFDVSSNGYAFSYVFVGPCATIMGDPPDRAEPIDEHGEPIAAPSPLSSQEDDWSFLRSEPAAGADDDHPFR